MREYKVFGYSNEDLKKKIKILTIIRWVSILWIIIAISQMTLWGKTIDMILGFTITIVILYVIITLPIIRKLKRKKHDIDIIKIGNEESEITKQIHKKRISNNRM